MFERPCAPLRHSVACAESKQRPLFVLRQRYTAVFVRFTAQIAVVTGQDGRRRLVLPC